MISHLAPAECPEQIGPVRGDYVRNGETIPINVGQLRPTTPVSETKRSRGMNEHAAFTSAKKSAVIDKGTI